MNELINRLSKSFELSDVVYQRDNLVFVTAKKENTIKADAAEKASRDSLLNKACSYPFSCLLSDSGIFRFSGMKSVC